MHLEPLQDIDSLRVLVANEDDTRFGPLIELITGLGHDVIAQTVEIAGVAELTQRERPDVALVSLGPSTAHALEMIDQIVQEAACPVIALIHSKNPDFVAEAARRGVFAAVTDRDPAEWQGSIDIVLRRFAEFHKLRAAFARRATIDLASGILMERHSIQSEKAFEMLRETARRSNRKLHDLATAVVDGHSLLPAGNALN